MTDREKAVDLLEMWSDGGGGSRSAVARTLQMRGRSFLIGFCRVMFEKLGPVAGASEMRQLEITLSEMED